MPPLLSPHDVRKFSRTCCENPAPFGGESSRVLLHFVEDKGKQTLRLSLKGHPMGFLRARFAAERVATCRQVQGLADGRRVRAAVSSNGA